LIAAAEERLGLGNDPKLSEAIAQLGLGLASDDATIIRDKSDALDALLGVDPFNIFSSLYSGASKPKAKAPKTDKPKTAPSEQVVVAAPSQALGKIFGGAT